MHGDINPENFEIGRVVSRTFNVLIRNVPTFLALSALLMIPVLLLTFYSAANPAVAAITRGARPLSSQFGQIYSTFLISGLLSAICMYVLQAALVQGAITDLNGERPSFGNCLVVGFKSFLPLAVIAVLSYLGTMLGFVLLIVPGIILAVSWSVVVPARVVEHTSITESFGRSRALTKGCRWKIFWLIVMYVIAAGIIELGLRPLFGAGLILPTPGLLGTPFLVVGWLVRVVLTAITAVGVASIYFELRLIKEGAGPAQLAAAFD